jgi:AAA+ ATPase superfamily predicted ATPase
MYDTGTFYGRERHLTHIRGILARIAAERRGQMLAVRGRRQAGKSRLFTEIVETSGLPHLYFSAVRGASTPAQLHALVADAAAAGKPVPDIDALLATPPPTWADAFRRIALAVRDAPSIVVFDEFPWATATDRALEDVLQNVWDRQLQHSPVLWVLIGSDLTAMERLTDHDRPLYGRAEGFLVQPFDPAECAEALGGRENIDARGAMRAFDGHLVTGGYPRLILRCAKFGSVEEFVVDQLQDENNDLAVIAERSLDAEFGAGDQARRVLSAIGGSELGPTTFSQVVGRLPEEGTAAQTATSRAVKLLSASKGVIAVERPLGAGRGSKLRRYRIPDSYLRFWFRFVERHIPNITRGRADIAVAAFKRDWATWRDDAIGPVVREAVLRLAADGGPLDGVEQVGNWWTRDSNFEFDVVGADRAARRVAVVGAVKWREHASFTATELDRLKQARAIVPGASRARLLAVCPAGVANGVRPDFTLAPTDMLPAWTPR